MPQDIYGVTPGSDDYSHEIVLRPRGRSRIGLKLMNGAQSLRIIPPQRQPPPVKLEQNSWQNGRGAEVWTPNAYNFYDAKDSWTSTPNKLHPALLQRWYTGFRDVNENMPDSGDVHKWLPLYLGTGNDANRIYQAVAYTPAVTSVRERSFLIVRRKGMPGTLTLEWCDDNGSGKPGATQRTVTKTVADAPDLISYYMEFKPSSVYAVSASIVYHLKIYGAITDNPNNCWEVLCSTSDAGNNSSNNSAWSATTYSPYYRTTDADINQRIFPFNFDGAWYAVTSRADRGNSKLYIHGCRGKATAGAGTTLTDSGSGQYGGTWTTNQWTGWKIRILRGTGQGQVRAIASNTATVVTVSIGWDINPDTTSEYVIYGGNSWKEITGHGLGWVSAKPIYANGIIYFPQNDTVDIRIMQMNYANANDHGFDAEDTAHNRAWFLCSSYDSTLGPVMVRGNQVATATGTPNGKAISIGRAPTSPNGTPVVFGTDLAFQTSILMGDNTFRITGLYNHQNQLYVAKEDTLYSVSGNVPVETKYGADASPNINNGVAACSGMDGQFYIAAEHDVFLISGGNTYPTNMPFNLPSNRAGYVTDLMSEKGWLFAAVDAGDGGTSSIMRMTLADRSWHEQVRAFGTGRRIRNMAWLSHSDTRSHLAFECDGELMYQEMPLFGVRPSQDSGCLYQHEAALEFPTMDLLNTDPKYFSFFTLHSKALANAVNAAVYGREIALDYQLNDNIGSSTWINAGSFGISPQDKVYLGQGQQMKIRPRLRIENNQPSNPPIVENMSLSLFSRTATFKTFQLDINASGDDEMSGEEIFDAISEMVHTAEPISTESIFNELDDKQMIVSVEPNVNITSVEENGFNAIIQLYLEYLPT